jgi:peptidoglycan glycosyltransferase
VSKKGAVVVLDPATGDLLASVSYPWPEPVQFAGFRANPDRSMERDLLDRARFGLYPPGSSFKIVTATAALRADPALAAKTYECLRLEDGRVGNYIGNSKRPIRDDTQDHIPHGTVDMARGITVSCNAYFAQLGTLSVGAQNLLDTANMFGIDPARPNTAAKLKEAIPQASYGQGQVVATPFQMARVAASVAAGGKIPQGRWVLDETNSRTNEAVPVLTPALAAKLGAYMRSVVTSPAGTGKVVAGNPIPIAGKTGTAELNHAASHAWFIGFAPYGDTAGRRIAFAVLVENGQYGGKAAAPIAGEIVTAARELGLL